jgi:hypothetical protein
MEYAFIERGELDQMLRASQLSSSLFALALLGEKIGGSYPWRMKTVRSELDKVCA